MLFHTSTFAIFFTLFLACYLPVRGKEAGIWVLLVFSNIFYGWWSWKFLGLLWVTVVVDYLIGRALGRTEDPRLRKLLVTVSIATNLGILGFFKYFNFFVASATAAGWAGAERWHIVELALPVGLSFYVFQSISYTVDVYRRIQQPVRNFLHFAIFVCFFPQLVAGPIQRLRNLLPRILAPAPITGERLVYGAFLFCVGFFRKAIADTIATFIDPTFANLAEATPTAVVMGVFGFGLQIYLDFTGYVDMARGVARIIGVDMMLNFNAPYLSTSPREFWRRWHISLSQWLRDYLYIPLGGNRHGMPRQLAALMITMLLGGLWHGAGFNFIIWGGLHGSYLVLNTLWDRYVLPTRVGSALVRLRVPYAFAGWLFTWLAVNYAWLYFRVPTFEMAMVANRKIVQWVLHPVGPQVTVGLVLLVAAVVVMEFLLRFRSGPEYPREFPLSLRSALWRGALAAAIYTGGLLLLVGVPTQQFIYFQF